MVKVSLYPIHQKIHYNARCWLDSATDSGVYCPLACPFLFLRQTHEPRRNDGAPATVLLWRGDDCRRPPLYRWDGADEPDPVAVAALPVLWGCAGYGPVGSRGSLDCPSHEVVRAEPGLGPRCRPIAECRVCRVCPLVRLPVSGVWVARHLSLARARRLT